MQGNNPGQKLTIVAAAALVGIDGWLLMQRRPLRSQHGGLWEFPGGKCEPGETLTTCLARELAEELTITIETAGLQPAGWSLGTTADGELLLALMICRRWTGNPVAQDGAELRWYAPGELSALAMPPADVPLAATLPGFL